ncbi:alpha/beta hydrolase [Polaribacter sp. R77954]|uniref:alpha/beta hydrolase n=1 Tax=Polaribacter sp. R77954 TaxID=3093870 RepID=UPI0037CAEB9F
MKNKLTLIALLLSLISIGQVKITEQQKTRKFMLVKMNSSSFDGQERTLKIALPNNYTVQKKYPVIYTLDGFTLFEQTLNYVDVLSKTSFQDGDDSGTNVIPECIIVSIFHENRSYETEPNFDGMDYLAGPQKLKNFLISEVYPYVTKNYSTSGFNVIIGHSNTAHFVTSLLFQNQNPFQNIIALSLVESVPNFNEIIIKKLNSDFDGNYFLGYGTRDNQFSKMAKNIESSIFKENIQVKEYNANHSDLPAAALLDAIKFQFRNYKKFDRFNEISKKENFNPKIYFDDYQVKMHEIYGINTSVNADDFDYLLTETINSKNKSAFEKLVAFDEKRNNFKYMPIVMFHNRKDVGDLIGAQKIAFQMIASTDFEEYRFLVAQLDIFSAFFIHDLKNPQEAISFLEKGKKNFKKYRLAFSYYIAKTAIEQKIQLKKAKKNLKYCLQNFKKNRYFSKKDLETLQNTLN